MNNAGQAIRIKKEILVRIIKAFLSDDFEEQARLIPYNMRPKGMEVPYRCCVYKERAIIKDRTIAGLGFPIEEDDETVLLRCSRPGTGEPANGHGHGDQPLGTGAGD